MDSLTNSILIGLLYFRGDPIENLRHCMLGRGNLLGWLLIVYQLRWYWYAHSGRMGSGEIWYM